MDNGGDEDAVYQDMITAEGPSRFIQKLACDGAIENAEKELVSGPITCDEIWVSSNGWFSTTVFTPCGKEKHLWTKYKIQK